MFLTGRGHADDQRAAFRKEWTYFRESKNRPEGR